MNHSRVYGLNACLAYAENRGQKIIRAFFSKKTAPQFSALMKEMAAQKKVYRIVPEEELEKISQTQHHEGVCFVIEKSDPILLRNWLRAQKEKSCLLILDNIRNPHNIGAILRICAHFGIQAVALKDVGIAQSGAAMRVAEGGAEFVQAMQYDDLVQLIRELKKNGFSIIATSSHADNQLYQYQFPEKCALLFGSETAGISLAALKQSDAVLQIPGTGHVESLNVSTAIAILLGEFYRQK